MKDIHSLYLGEGIIAFGSWDFMKAWHILYLFLCCWFCIGNIGHIWTTFGEPFGGIYALILVFYLLIFQDYSFWSLLKHNLYSFLVLTQHILFTFLFYIVGAWCLQTYMWPSIYITGYEAHASHYFVYNIHESHWQCFFWVKKWLT